MNPTIELLLNHRSIRNYDSRPIAPDDLDLIIEAAYRGPTSMNAQQVSVIVVQDPDKRARLAAIAGGQGWIETAPVFLLLVADFNKTAKGVALDGKTQKAHESVESLIVGGVDCGIALGNMMAAAASLGLGSVPIGGIRRDPQAVCDLFRLPPLTFPIVGLCLGAIEKDSPIKPRLPMGTFRHDEVYDDGGYIEAMQTYDTTLGAYWESIGRADGVVWTANTAAAYSKIYYPQVYPTLIRQGFKTDQ